MAKQKRDGGQLVGSTYKDRSGKHRWRIKSVNGRTVAASGESFSTLRSARRALMVFVSNIAAGRYRDK